MVFPVGSYVWVPDEAESYIAGRVKTSFEAGKQGAVTILKDDTTRTVGENESKNLLRMDEQSLSFVENMVHLKELNEGSILENIRLGFNKDKIYSSVGTILVAVNPFKQLPLYTPEVLDEYRSRGDRSHEPHVFGVADNAYKSLVNMQENQSCIISGESGAGKTETTKLFLQYLTEVSLDAGKKRRESTDRPISVRTAVGGLQEQILQANPLMEAFGNAKTVRNDNSSRFGKWIEIKFDPKKASMIGGRITSYLLEKSRLVKQSEGERNYHIFYQLCAGAKADPKFKEWLCLGEADEYHYLNQSGRIAVESINDEADWEKVKRAMEVMRINDDERNACLEILAGVLHLGNLVFVQEDGASDDGQAIIENREVLDRCARFIGVSSDSLQRVLSSRSMGVRSVIFKPYSKVEAQHARDALSKAIYGKLFEWLISRINDCLDVPAESSASDTIAIGVLDIFGFESFEVNSFEQLCINYCNEKLQLHFNSHIFQLEQDEYRKENIDFNSITFSDNKPCVDMLESKGTGVFSMIDEEINVPKGSDQGFLSKILQKSNNVVKRASVKAMDSDKSFVIVHYAGDVIYNVTGFLDKNKDLLHEDLHGCVQISKNAVLAKLFEPEAVNVEDNRRSRSSASRSKNRKTLGHKFKDQLQTLMETLNATNPHFIRCVKPNAEKVGDLFTSPMVLSQLRYAGLLQVCRIRQLGYPVRQPYSYFVKRYGPICGAKATDVNTLCSQLEQKEALVAGDWQVGKTKVFLRNDQHQVLENMREGSLCTMGTIIQSYFRGYSARRMFSEWKDILKQLEAAQTAEALRLALQRCAESIPFQGANIQCVKDARIRYDQMLEIVRVEKLLAEALGSLDIAALNTALAAAKKISLDSQGVRDATAALVRVEEARKVRIALEEAISARDLEQLTLLLARATNELGLTVQQDDKVREATALKVRLEGENALSAEVAVLVETGRSLAAFEPVLGKVAEWGIERDDNVILAESICSSLREVRAAENSRDYDKLKSVLDNHDRFPSKNHPPNISELVDELAKEKSLKLAIASGDVESVQEVLSGITSQTTKKSLGAQAEKMIERETVKRQLSEYTAAKDVQKLQAVVARAVSIRLGDVAELKNAYAFLDQADEDSALLSAINMSVSARDATRLKELAAQAKSEGKDGIAAKAEEAGRKVEADGKFLAAIASCQTTNQVETCCQKYSASSLRETVLQVAREVDDAIANETGLDAVLTLAIEAGLVGMSSRIETAMKESLQRVQMEQALQTAFEDNDRERMLLILNELGDNNTSQIVTQCRSLLDRELKLIDVEKAIEEAVQSQDLDKLNTSMERLIEMGVTPSEAVKAHRAKLESQREMCAEVIAETKALIAKANGVVLLTVSDLDPLREARAAYRGDENIPEIERARSTLEQMEDRIQIQAQLENAIETGEYTDLKSALEKSQENEMSEALPLVKKARALFRDKDKDRRIAQREAFEAGDEEQKDIDSDDQEEEGDEDVVNKANLERRERASQSRYLFTNYHNIRSDESFVKGMFLHKSRAAKNKLWFQNNVINRSLIDFGDHEKELNKSALRLHKCLLGYCGDKSMSFPATLAQDILAKALETPELVDEVYVQVCKHLTNNPRVESVAKAWQVMILCVSTFPPSKEFEPFLLNFLLMHENIQTAMGNYARFSLCRLEGMINSGSSGYVPTVEEIQSYNDRPPILAKIELVDGTVLAEQLPVTPDLDVEKVNQICSHVLGLCDPRASTFGIAIDGKVPLRPVDYIGDEYMKSLRNNMETRLVFMRNVVLKLPGKDEPSDEDPMYNRLVYLQAQHDFVVGKFSEYLNSKQVVELVAEALAVDFGDEIPPNPNDLLKETELLKDYLPGPDKLEPAQVAEKALEIYRQNGLAAQEPDELQNNFVAKVKGLACYGMVTFDTEDKGTVGIDSNGIHFEGTVYTFPQLYRWGGSSSQFTIVVWNPQSQDEKKEIT
eukprot:CAMPEP_0203750560 /NCGR_PEP_ID=MMETSP0098-20131031/4778_1 /ASSEMBLY_ACC=CAM_ASM_000208 /TAXON_ID=96639 /ORGANISM=" , Strain NY0313808BC1" /LENGTH=1960 /DNA_ID=CAMNT_0050639919 /DNA_START=298 /DNA_END=6177 /DNA_ORIENTATION=+